MSLPASTSAASVAYRSLVRGGATILWLCLGTSCALLAAGPAFAGEPAAEAPAGPQSAGCWLGLAQAGGTGLFDLPLAEAGCPWRLRVGVGLTGFTETGYLLADDSFTQLTGTVQVAASIGAHLEAALQFGGSASRAVRPIMGSQPGDTSLLSLGDIDLTVKLHTQWGSLVHAAVRPVLRVHSGPDDLGPDFRSADIGVDILGTVDFQKLKRALPLRLHWLLGYIYDRSSELLGSQDCMAAGSAQCLATRLISTAAYDVGQPRLRLAVGADALFALHRKVSLGPLLVYHADIVTGDGDPVLQALLHMQGEDAAANDRVAQWLTLGALLRVPLPMTVELGMRIGLQDAGYAMGVKLNQLSGYAALTWELDLASSGREGGAGATGHGASESDAASSERSAGSGGHGQGTVSGAIRDAQTGVPLADAVVRFVGVPHNALLTDNRGEFRSAPLPSGAVMVEASRGDHLTSRQIAWVRAGESPLLELRLPPIERPALSRLSLEVRDEAGGPLLATATLSRDGQSLQLLPQPGGLPAILLARVPAGPWTLRVDANGYLSREQIVVLSSGGDQRLSLPLMRRALVPRVQLGAGEILLGEPLEFQPGTAAFSADSARILDEVIDLLVHHPELHQLRIEHQGFLSQKSAAEEATQQTEMLSLWEQQAIAVRDYLVQRGVAPERVVAQVVPLSPGRGKVPHILLKVAAEPQHPPAR